MTQSMNLAPFGLQMVLSKGAPLDALLTTRIMKEGSFSKTQGRVQLPSGEYSVGSFMGEGSFGSAYQIVHAGSNTVSVIKVVKPRFNMIAHVQSTLKECIIHIILDLESRGEPEGPYVPRFYEVAYDHLRQLILIRMERMHGTLLDKFYGATPDQNDVLVPEAMASLAHILHFFYKRFKFNHRDLKSDNVMYNYGPNNKLMVKLIDFTFCCLTWNGLQINGGSYFSEKDACYIPSRDLTQFVYEIHMNLKKRFSPQLVAILEHILTFELKGGNVCRMFKGCTYNRRSMKRWGDTYDFLKHGDVLNPKATPKEIYKRMFELLGRQAPRQLTTIDAVQRLGSAAETVKCLPEQIMNPKTRRCVKRSGAVGRRIMRLTQRRSPSPVDPGFQGAKSKTKTKKVVSCGTGRVRNPITNRCRKVDAGHKGRVATARLKPCRQGLTRDPKTRRCIKAHPRPARKPTSALVPCRAGLKRDPKTRRCMKPKVGPKPCSADKIRNPRTRRCVSRKSRVGQLVEAAQGVRKLEEFFKPKK